MTVEPSDFRINWEIAGIRWDHQVTRTYFRHNQIGEGHKGDMVPSTHLLKSQPQNSASEKRIYTVDRSPVTQHTHIHQSNHSACFWSVGSNLRAQRQQDQANSTQRRPEPQWGDWCKPLLCLRNEASKGTQRQIFWDALSVWNTTVMPHPFSFALSPPGFPSLSAVSVRFLSLHSLCHAHLFLQRSKSNSKPSPAFFVYCMTPPQMHQFKFWHPWLNLICRGDEEPPQFLPSTLSWVN